MKDKIIAIILGFMVIFAASCTEKVDLKLESGYERLVVVGSVTDRQGPQRITLTKTSDYFYNAPAPKVVGATVKVTDGTSTWNFKETEPGVSGVYDSPRDFTGNPGRTYTMTAELAEPIAGHNTYESSCYLPAVTHLDSIRTEFQPDWGKKGFWLVKIYAQDPPGERNYYMLNIYKNGHLWSDTITKVSVSDDQFFDGTYLNGADAWLINNEHDWQTLHKGDTVRVELSGVTKEYYNFIQQVQQSGFNIPFFSGPPANVQGNVNNDGTGFFSAYSSSFASTVVK
ncbi:MAG: DUF4249 domain-containing protein [Syntrophothermus sp.]